MSDIIRFQVAHDLSQEEAFRRVRGLLVKVSGRHQCYISDLREKWDRKTCRFGFLVAGFQIYGAIRVEGAFVEIVSWGLPRAVQVFQEWGVEDVIISEAKRILMEAEQAPS